MKLKRYADETVEMFNIRVAFNANMNCNAYKLLKILGISYNVKQWLTANNTVDQQIDKFTAAINNLDNLMMRYKNIPASIPIRAAIISRLCWLHIRRQKLLDTLSYEKQYKYDIKPFDIAIYRADYLEKEFKLMQDFPEYAYIALDIAMQILDASVQGIVDVAWTEKSTFKMLLIKLDNIIVISMDAVVKFISNIFNLSKAAADRLLKTIKKRTMVNYLRLPATAT